MTLALPGPASSTPITSTDITPANLCSSPAAFITGDAPWGTGNIVVPRHVSQSIVRFVATQTTEPVAIVSTAVTPAAYDYHFAIYQNGVYFADYQISQTGAYLPQYFTIAGLTVGATVDIYEPTQGPYYVGSPPIVLLGVSGGYVLRLYYSTPIQVLPSRATVIYGNSYAGSYGASTPWSAHGFVGGLRAIHPAGGPGIFIRQWSSNGYLVFSDSTHETALQVATALENLCRGTGSNEIAIVGLGRNDWFYNSGTAAQVATRAAAIVDQIHADLPSVKILLATVWLTLSEGANAGGQTLPQYRTAELAVASGRSSFLTVVDLSDPSVMPTWNTATDLFDDSHPNDAGYAKIVTALRTRLPLGPI